MHVEAAGGTVNVDSFTGNTVTNNMGNGVWFDANNAAGGGTINVTDFQGNTITGNGTAAVGPIGSDPDGLLISAQGAHRAGQRGHRRLGRHSPTTSPTTVRRGSAARAFTSSSTTRAPFTARS